MPDLATTGLYFYETGSPAYCIKQLQQGELRWANCGAPVWFADISAVFRGAKRCATLFQGTGTATEGRQGALRS